MRVLHVVQSLKGGTASYLNEILPDQAQRWGHSCVGLVVPEADLEYLAPELADCPRFLFPDARRDPLSLARFMYATAAAYRMFEPDIVHLHSTFAGAVGRVLLLPRIDRPKVVYCAHGWAFDREQSASAGAIAAVERLLARMTDAIVNISAAEGRSAALRGVRARRNVVMPNAIADTACGGEAKREAVATRLGYDRSKINLLFVGRHDRQKGADIAEAAAALLPADRFHLHNIGAAVVGGAETLGSAPPNVTRLGWLAREDVLQHMRAADALVVPSRWEGFGLAAIEAMRAGTAVFVSAAGALPEIVVDGMTGCVIAGNAPEAYAAAIGGLDRSALTAMGVAGRSRFEKLYRRERLLSELDGLYRSLAGEVLDANPEAATVG